MSRTPLAVAGAAPLAYVDEHGYVTFNDGWRVEWWILGDDHWHVPRASTSVRQRSIDNTPIRETVMRVPGGDVKVRAAATIAGQSTVIAFECENSASIPVALGLALVDPAEKVDLDVFPVTHSTTWRGALRVDPPTDLPDIAAVVRGWLALGRQGAQIETNDPMTDDALTAARCDALLRHGELVAMGKKAPKRAAASVANALTLLGYDDEAGALRRSARIRPSRKGLPLVNGAADDDTVATIRSQIVDDTHGGIDLLPGYDASWRGRSIDVREVPTNHGIVSFALRWHGERPALLWDLKASKPVSLTATAVAPAWSAAEMTGEALLRP